MPRGLPATLKQFFKDNAQVQDGLVRLHRTDQIGKPTACPTGDAESCPKCMTLDALELDKIDAIKYVKAQGYDTTPYEDTTASSNK